MKTFCYIFLSSCLVTITGTAHLRAQTKVESSPKLQSGFVDKNKDGINDKFNDANGDGINDATGKRYDHSFEFVDKNKDGRNDLWLDRDGDGVNDLLSKLSDKNRRTRENCILDGDGDGRNDITGMDYTLKDLQGDRFGFIDEKSGKVQGKHLDENGNGIDDRMEKTSGGQRHGNRDMFIDEDGDGICDGRGASLRRQGRRGGHRRGNKN